MRKVKPQPDYPFIFMSDVGTAGFSEEEVVRLRQYLLRGGFLHVDDFWGNAAWDHWAREIGRVLPPQQYPIQDIPLDHPVFSVLYRVSEVPQIPSFSSGVAAGAELPNGERKAPSRIFAASGMEKDG
jgi:hypothetical protein